MRARAADEERASTPLELFFDLCFVVGVAAVSDRLHHALSAGHAAEGVIGYLALFFAIWWAWMNFTWFASAYNVDDVPYRLATFVQITGVLILAAGVPRAFDERDFALIVSGYAVMRAGLVTQWLRAARGDGPGRRVALRYAIGVSACMVGWLGLLVLPVGQRLPLVVVMGAVELAVPVWAERGYRTAWHPGHIAERFGLFTLIVLGEAVFAATMAIKTALAAGGRAGELILVAASGLVVVFGMWWLYFGQRAERILRSNRDAFPWGYGHYLIFASAAAVGAGLGVVIDQEAGLSPISARAATTVVAVPVAVFLVCVWLLHVRPHRLGFVFNLAFPATAGLVLLSLATPIPLPVIAVLMALLVAETVIQEVRG